MANNSAIETRAGKISVMESGGSGPAVLLIHGNSGCKEVWRHQFDHPMAARYRFIAIDLPGHGASDDARQPARDYTMQGYADIAVEVLQALDISSAAVVGWSLGGHIGLEMISRFSDLTGLLISGSPPVRPEEVSEGFQMNETTALASKVDFSEDEVLQWACGCIKSDAPLPFAVDAIRRSDGRARATMFAAFLAGEGEDQRTIAEAATLPIAVVNGAAENFINNDFLKTVAWRNLWSGKIHLIPDARHGVFWEKHEAFNALLEEFLDDVRDTQA